ETGDLTIAHQGGSGAAAFCVVAVTRCALVGVDHRALRGRAAAFRQSRTVRQDADVPGRDGSLVDRLAEIGCLGQDAGERQAPFSSPLNRMIVRHASSTRSSTLTASARWI